MSRYYEPFIIRVEELEGEYFPVTASYKTGSWSGSIPAGLPLLEKAEIQEAHVWLEAGNLERKEVKEFGQRLFQTLFSGPILEGFREAYQHSAIKGGLRIVLTLPESLAGFPWELMYDNQGGHGFLARSATAPLARQFMDTPIAYPPPDKGPIRILVVIAEPRDYPSLNSEQELGEITRRFTRKSSANLISSLKNLLRTRSLRSALKLWQRGSLVKISLLEHPTRQSLQERIIAARDSGQNYHVVHFIGHGYGDTEGGYLVMETASGEGDPIPAEEFAEIIAEPGVNLVFLNACQTASPARLYESVAKKTIQRRVPVVIGMQVPILDQAAVRFAGEFYGAWAAGEPIESALAYARRLIVADAPGERVDWGIPVLYMGPAEGLTLRIPEPAWRWPWPMKLTWTAVGLLFSVLSGLALITQIHSIEEYFRSEFQVTRCLFPIKMQGGFNVAVADFGIIPKDASAPQRSQEGEDKSKKILNEIRVHYAGLAGDFSDLGLIAGRYCMIPGKDPGERRQAALDLAQRSGADLVVYGYLDEKIRGISEWKFYFLPTDPSRQWSELFSEERLGKVPVPSNALFMEGWSQKENVIIDLALGLLYLNVGDTKAFLQKVAVGWPGEDVDEQSKEMYYLFLGAGYLMQAIGEDVGQDAQNAYYHYRCARHWFILALRASPEEKPSKEEDAFTETHRYDQCTEDEFSLAEEAPPLDQQDPDKIAIRPRFGLALIDYHQSLFRGKVIDAGIEEAIKNYTALLDALSRQQGTGYDWLDLKLHYQRGLAYSVLADNYTDTGLADLAGKDYAQAAGDFQTVVRLHDSVWDESQVHPNLICRILNGDCSQEDPTPQFVRELTARSLWFLGVTEFEIGRYEEALKYFQRIEVIAPKHAPDVIRLAHQYSALAYAQTGKPDLEAEEWKALYKMICRDEEVKPEDLERLIQLDLKNAEEVCDG